MKTKQIEKLSGMIKNKSIPICDGCQVKEGNLILTDLEVFVTVKNFPAPEGVYFDRKLFLAFSEQNLPVENLLTDEDFPVLPEQNWNELGDLYKSDLDKIRNATKVTGKDDLRPVMKGVFFDKGKICATNAHILYYDRLNFEFEQSFNIPSKVVRFLLGDYFRLAVSDEWVKFENSDLTVISRLIDGKYPNYKVVIPSYVSASFLFNNKEITRLLEEGKNFVNETTKLVVVSPGKLVFRDIERNIEVEKECSMQVRNYENVENLTFGVNLNLLKILLSFLEDDIELKFQAPNRAMILNEKTLLMPVMI